MIKNHPHAHMPLLQRFMCHVSKDSATGCWNWTGCKSRTTGYGYFQIWSDHMWKMKLAHRVSYQLFKGPIPKGKCACHSCDNTSCVNPNHLWAGTQNDNVQDMKRKGRGPKGVDYRRAKLTEHDVRLMRKLYRKHSREFGTPALAKRFGVTPMTIYFVVTGTSWKHIE